MLRQSEERIDMCEYNIRCDQVSGGVYQKLEYCSL